MADLFSKSTPVVPPKFTAGGASLPGITSVLSAPQAVILPKVTLFASENAPTQPIGADAPTPPAGPPPTTPELRDEAHKQTVHDTLKGALLFAGLAEGLGRFVHPKAPETAKSLSHNVTGFELTPVKGTPRARPTIGAGTIIFGLFPAPIGFAPPEIYGGDPDFMIQGMKKNPGPGAQTFIDVVGLMGGNPGGERQAYSDAKKADQVRDLFQGSIQFKSDERLISDLLFVRQGVNPVNRDPFRPAELLTIGLTEVKRRHLAIDPAVLEQIGVTPTNDPIGLFPVPGSIQPLEIEPVTGAALANLALATGIRKELVHERADP